MACTLQAALLPASLPQPDHLDIVARYLAAAEHDLVDGDWYDCVVMPSGDTHLMIGDVEGHDVRAAAMMGTLRNMLRAFAWASKEPPADCMIGVAPGRRRHDQVAELPPGSTLVFYTDGLIESDEHDIDRGIDRLQVSMARHHQRPLQEMIDHLTDELVGANPSDDVAVLAVRFNPQD